MDGEVKYVLTDDDDVEKEIKVLNYLIKTVFIFKIQRDTAGGYFGELALIQDKPRAVTVSSVGVTKWYVKHTCLYSSCQRFTSFYPRLLIKTTKLLIVCFLADVWTCKPSSVSSARARKSWSATLTFTRKNLSKCRKFPGMYFYSRVR